MAAIDPTEEPMYDEDDTEKKAPRATLKIVRIPGDFFGDDEDDSEDDEDDEDDSMGLLNGLSDDSEEDSEEEEVNGGPSEPKRAKALKAVDEDDAEDDDEDMDEKSDAEDAAAIAALKKIMKGKAKAEGSDDEEDDLEDDEDPLELEEIVVCTLDPEKVSFSDLDTVYDSKLTHFPELPTNSRLRCRRGRASFLQGHGHTHYSPHRQLCHPHGRWSGSAL
jgi:FK506-binding nuclear protein